MGATTVPGRRETEVDGLSLESVPLESCDAADRPAPSVGHAPTFSPAAEPLVRVITGHYGSGKTEVSVSLAMHLAAAGRRVALGDLDIVNPYFRSRERAELMSAAGIEVISSSLGHTITQDLPAVSDRIRGPIGDPACDVVIDAGGNEAGAKVLVGFRADLLRRGCVTLLVVNAYRPETADVAGVLRHLRAIEDTSGLPVTGLVSNTHVCRESTLDDVLAGYRLTRAVREATGLPIEFVCGIPAALSGLADHLDEPMDGYPLPIGLYLRDPWM